MRWMKHYSDAHTSNDLSKLILDLGFEGYGRYWHLLEFLAYQFDGETTIFKLHPAIVRESLRIRSWNKLRTFVERIGNVRGMETEYSENIIKIDARILLELQAKDFRRARHGRNQTASKNKNKNKDIDKEKNNKKSEIVSPISSFENNLNFDLQGLFKLYPRQEKRTQSLQALARLIDSQEKFEAMKSAVENYSKHCAENKKQYRYQLAFPKFLEEWRDWLDQDNGTSNLTFDEKQSEEQEKQAILSALEGL